MTSSSSRLLPVGLLVGIIAACVPSGAAIQTETAVSPVMSPPSANTVLAEETNHQPVLSLEQLLAGRIAGVMVTKAPSGGISVRIGGPTSFLLSNEPLFVVDGVPIEPGPNGTLSWLNPHDVESIQVLKYAAATALYGVRGGNGVVVITTKGSR
jgi:TonB-dependent SusC/RagA subfamily outer membrane receptor